MASRSLGVLTLDLVAKTGAFTRGMDQAERKARSSLGNIEKRASAFGKTLGVALGVSLAGIATGAVAALKGAIDRMDELRDASIRLGVGVETLSAFSYAAQQTGTDIDSLGKAFKILAKNIADAGKEGSAKDNLFDAIGVSIKDAEGNLRSLEDIVPDIANAFTQLQDGTQKAALAQELFGKSGLEMTEFLNQGSEGLRDFTERARELGLVIDQEAADKADKFNDTLADLKGAVTGLATGVAIDLLPQLTEMVKWAQDWVSDGDNAKKTATEIASAVRDIADAISSIGSVLGALDSFKDGLSDIQKFLVDWSPGTSIRKKIQEALFGRSGDWDLNGFVNDFSGVEGGVSGTGTMIDFSGVKGGFHGRSSVNQGALNRALAGDTGGGGGKGRSGGGGKSDAEKAAEEAIRLADQAKESVDSLNESYAKQIALFGDTSEAAQLRYEFEHEDISKLDAQTQAYIKTQRDSALANAERIDQLKAEKDVKDELDRIDKQRSDSVHQVLTDIQAERDVLGQSAEYQDTYNKLKYAGVDANSAFGQSIIDANHALYEQAKAVADQVEAMDGFRDASEGLFVDLVNSAQDGKNAWDIVKQAANDYAQVLLRMIAQNLVEKAFGEKGTTGGGSSGGWISTALSAIFGASSGGGGGSFVGPRAIGGPVAAGSFALVNEHGPELLSMGGRDYLMMGAQSGQVSANRNAGRSRGGDTYINNFEIRGRDSTATRDQTAALADATQRRQRIRNNKR